MRILLIGFGSIGQEVAVRVAAITDARIAGIVVRDRRFGDRAAPAGAQIMTSIDGLEHGAFDIAVECAGHSALAQYGPRILEAGRPLIVVSAGAMADRALYDRLVACASRGGGRITFVAGALAGIDALSSAREAGLDDVRYESRKPPASWRGTPAESVCDLDALTEAYTFFDGRADDAARRYPKNANAAATVALAGVGFEKTRVALIADPHATMNVHRICASGAFGTLAVEIENAQMPGNPRTSFITALSVMRALRNRAERLEI